MKGKYSRVGGEVMGRDVYRLSEVEYCINKLLNSNEEGDMDRARILTLTKTKKFMEYVKKYKE